MTIVMFGMRNTYVVSLIMLFVLQVADAASKVVITGDDKMQFNKREFEVAAGQVVELEFKNVGKLPKAAMGHNLVILKEGVSALSFGSKALKAGASSTNPLPKSVMDEVLAHTKLLGPGESETIEFVAPAKKGLYQFVCTFPGHYSIMRGIMVVK